MPTVILRPSTAGTNEDWSPGGGANAGLTGDDADGTTVNVSFEQQKDSHALDNMPADARAIDSVTAFVRASGSASGSPQISIFSLLSGTDQSTGNFTLLAALNTFSVALPRPGGGAWTVTNINDVEVGYEATSILDAAKLPVVDDVWLSVDYRISQPQTGTVRVSRTAKGTVKASRQQAGTIRVSRMQEGTAKASRTQTGTVRVARTAKGTLRMRRGN